MKKQLIAMYKSMKGKMNHITWEKFHQRLVKVYDSAADKPYAGKRKIAMGGKEWAVFEQDGTPYYVDTASGASVWNLEGVDSLEEMFNVIDYNKDGDLSIEELEYALRTQEFSEYIQYELREIVKMLRGSKRASLNWKEFVEEQVRVCEERKTSNYTFVRNSANILPFLAFLFARRCRRSRGTST